MNNLRAAGFFVARTPLLPFDVLRDWAEGVSAPGIAAGGDDAALSSALARDRALLRTRLRALVERPEVAEAIYVATPSLRERASRWYAEPESKDGAKVQAVLVRYLGRMASRPTPFGLFAAATVGHVSGETKLALEAGGRRHVRLDMEYLVRICEGLARDPSLRQVLPLRVNTSLYAIGERVRFAALRVDGSVRGYDLVDLEADEPLRTALRVAGGAARVRAREIAAALTDDDVGIDDALAYVSSLVDEQVLEVDLAPPVTCDEPLQAVLSALDEAGDGGAATGRARGPLAAAREGLDRLDQAPLGLPPSAYRAVADVLTPLAVQTKESRTFQVDMTRAGTATLAHGDVEAIRQGLDVLRVFVRHREPMAAFAEAFAARYERQEVPLLQALDDDVGVGFQDAGQRAAAPAPLLAGLPLAGAPASEQAPMTPAARVLSRKLAEVWASGADELRLVPDDWRSLREGAAPLPSSVAAMVSVLGPEPGGTGRRLHLRGFMGASAARLLGRFSAHSAELTERLRAHLRDEESLRPGAIFAEIVHMPVGARMGNLLLRPVLRDHEIVFSCKPGVRAENAIPVSDLLVSVRGGKVVLRSARLGREVVPRLSSAHNAAPNSLAIYRFLVAMQGQGCVVRGAFGWGPFEQAATLPRVVVDRVVLAPQQWRLGKADLAGIAVADGAKRFRAVVALRERRNLPRFVGLVDADNVLPIDLENVLSIDAMLPLVRRRPEVVVTELFCAPEDSCVASPAGRYTNEIVVPFLNVPASVPAPARASARPRFLVRRRFAPGSEWLYAKIYASVQGIEDVLTACVRPFVAGLPAGVVDRWFFIRYNDPEPHVRLRLHGEPGHLWGKLLGELERSLSAMMDDGRVARLETATYEREIERYGGDEGIELCEHVFTADSVAALGALEALRAADRPERWRWRWALLGTDRMLHDFGFDVGRRAELVGAQRGGLMREARTGAEGKRALGDRFRRERAALDALLASGDPRVNPIFDARSAALAPLVSRLNSLGERSTVDAEALVAALLHMWNNRLLLTQARRHELVIHDFLSRLYDSKIARAGRSPSSSGGRKQGPS